jgi:hypothetical protein
VCDVFAHEAVEVRFVQGDDVIQQFTSACADPSFRQPVLSRRLRSGSFWVNPRRFQKRRHAGIELRVAVEDRVSIGASFRKCFAQLLHDPLGTGVAGDIEMQNLPSCMIFCGVRRYVALAMTMQPCRPTNVPNAT